MSSNSSALVTFHFYYTPLLCLSGFMGNSFTVLIFYKTILSRVSSSYYLAALAINDNVFLVSLFVVWLETVGGSFFNQPVICQSVVYLTGICSFLNVWLVVAFTLERYVAVNYPFLRTSLCTTRRAKMAVAVLTAVAFVFFSPVLVFSTTITMKNNVSVCHLKKDWTKAATLFNYVDFCVTFVVPVVLVVFLNISIGRTLIGVSRARKMLTNRRVKIGGRRCQVSKDKITKMLLVVSTVFLCLNFPSYIMRILTYLIQLKLLKIDDLETFYMIQQWCLHLFYTNFGINFYLYCISGQNFRTALVGLFRTRQSASATENLILSDSRTTPTHSSSRCKKKANVCVHVAVKETSNQERMLSTI